MREIDKIAVGRRIREIRKQSGLRQWELARLLGTTQSAVHKYEHGVVPEPGRLMELARVGSTTIEWILTGRHWDGGDDTRERIPPPVLRTASLLRDVSYEQRSHIDEALRILREAVRAVHEASDDLAPRAPDALVRALAEHGPATLRLLESARRVQDAVLHRLAGDATTRLAAGNGGTSTGGD